MDKVIKDILDSNQGFVRDQQRLLTMLDKHPTIPDLFDYLFTGSPVTTSFSHFFIEKSTFDKELFELNKALCDECNKRIKLVGLGNFAYSFSNYNGLYLGINNRIPVDKLPSFVMLPYGIVMEYNLYKDIASRGVVEAESPITSLSIAPFDSSMQLEYCYDWDKEHRFISRGNEDDLEFDDVFSKYWNRLNYNDKQYIINSIADKYGYYKWAVRLHFKKSLTLGKPIIINKEEVMEDAKKHIIAKLPYTEKLVNKWYNQPMKKLINSVFSKDITYKYPDYKFSYYDFGDD